MNTTFQYWYEEVADMPMKEDGEWIDGETGFTYKSWAEQMEREHKEKIRKISDKAQSSRNVAKALGGKALKGSMKQKNWAEHLRREFLEKIRNDDDRVEVLLTSGNFDHAKFWIETRNNKPEEILGAVDKLKELIEEANNVYAQLVESEHYDERFRQRVVDPKLVDKYHDIKDKIDKVRYGNIK